MMKVEERKKISFVPFLFHKNAKIQLTSSTYKRHWGYRKDLFYLSAFSMKRWLFLQYFAVLPCDVLMLEISLK